jgi:hypothetical protein
MEKLSLWHDRAKELEFSSSFYLFTGTIRISSGHAHTDKQISIANYDISTSLGLDVTRIPHSFRPVIGRAFASSCSQSRSFRLHLSESEASRMDFLVSHDSDSVRLLRSGTCSLSFDVTRPRYPRTAARRTSPRAGCLASRGLLGA